MKSDKLVLTALLDLQGKAPSTDSNESDHGESSERDKFTNKISPEDNNEQKGNDDENQKEEEEDVHRNDDDDDDEDNSEDSESGSSSDESESFDEEETEMRRVKYLGDMDNLEKQFTDLKEQLYKERFKQIETKLCEVQKDEAIEYYSPLAELQEASTVRRDIAEQMKKLRLINADVKYSAELLAAEQQFKNEKNGLMESMRFDFEEKLRKVEEDRHVDMDSGWWFDDTSHRRKRRKGAEPHFPEKRKKPFTVVGPYIVYMVREMEILEDWTAIRKAKSELARRKAEELYPHDKNPHITARYEDGKFYYEGEWFQKGDKVILDNRVDSPVSATISIINTGEVWVSKKDGGRCKLYIAQFQKGKYLMKRQIVQEAV